MNDSIPYWKSGEVPEVVDVGNQRYKHYKEAGLIEVSTIVKEGDSEKTIRYQAISAHRLLHSPALCDMLFSFLSAAGLISKVE